MGDSITAEHTVLTKHTMVVVEPSKSDYTVDMEQTDVAVVVVQIASRVATTV